MASARRRAADAADAALASRRESPPARDLGARLALGALAAVPLLAPLVVDPAAEASFDAPKRLVTLVGIALAFASGLMLAPSRGGGAGGASAPWRAADARARAIALLAGAALALGIVAALASPRAALSTGALRVVLPLALCLPLGASRVLERGGAATLLAAFLVAASVDALTSLLERAGLVQLLVVESAAGRGGTGAFVGNEGSLALLLALGSVAALAVLLQARARTWRVAAGGALVLQLAALAVSPSLTAIAALLAGVAVVAGASLGRRGALLLAGCVLAVALVTAAYAPLRERVTTAARAARAGDWDALLTYRLGPWAAAAEMVRARPLVGFGPGTFGAEFAAQRLRSEERHRRRFVLPRETSTFAEAHNEYLQVLAEAGVPAGAAVLAALALSVAALARRIAATPPHPARADLVVVLGLVTTGAVGALTWFPLQLAATAPVLLLALGRGWRLIAAPPSDAVTRDVPARDGQAVRVARAIGAVALVALVALPELRRFRAERTLARATGAVQAVIAGRAGAAERVLDDARAWADASAAALPGDPRPVLAAGAIELVARRPQQALERYRTALALGERAETDLNAGRAYAMLDRRPEALAAFVRTAWLSPALVPSMPAAARPLAEAEVARLDGELRAGTLAGPPPLPEALRVPGVR